MFERWIAGKLEETTRAYIKNLPREQLRVNFRKGHLELENLELRPGPVLDGALAIRAGLIRKVVLDIPWSGLSKEPIRLSIDGLSVLLCPGAEYLEHRRIAQRESSAALDSELDDASAPSADGAEGSTGRPSAQGGGGGSGPPSRVLQWIGASAQIRVTNVSVRFESSVGSLAGLGGVPHGFSITIGELSSGVDAERTEAAKTRAASERTKAPRARLNKVVLLDACASHLRAEQLTARLAPLD